MNPNTLPEIRTQTESRMLQLDLRSVRLQLQSERGWGPDSTLRIEMEYRRFLCGELERPSPLVDIFWHAHILDTQKYAEDCQLLFGAFLHHIPEGKKGKCRKAVAA